MPKLLTILGARPQFIKAAALTRAIESNPQYGWTQEILHTGQHYDHTLSKVFFDTLVLPEPKWQFTLKNTTRPERMEEMRVGIQKCIDECKPSAVLVYGDTDSTLAGAQIAKKSNIPLIHVEAGLRSFDLAMPEEVNRIETDKLADILVAPTKTAVQNLENEGIFGAFLTGDIMHDNALHFSSNSNEEDQILLTMHRPSNVDDGSRAVNWIKTIGSWAKSQELEVVFPIHPRTKKSVESELGESWQAALLEAGVKVIDPVDYMELLKLISSSKLVVTDSGGIQKEAYSCATPSVVIRHNTEWVELLENGCAVLCPEPNDFEKLAEDQIKHKVDTSNQLYGDGKSAEYILEMLSRRLGMKVVVKSPHDTPRMRYASDLLFGTCLGVEVDFEQVGESETYSISFGDSIITCPIHPLSLSKDKEALNSGVEFPCKVECDCDLGYDPLASAIYLAAQWNVVFNHGEFDNHNRERGMLCDRPEVEILALNLAEKLGIPKTSKYSYLPTIDVDVAYAFKGRSFVTNSLACIRDLVTLRWSNLFSRMTVLFGLQSDPYDTYDWLDELHAKHSNSTTAFVLHADHKKPYDIGLPKRVVKNLVDCLKSWDVYWHPSYKAMTGVYNGNVLDFNNERGEFPGSTTQIRAHYLRSDARIWPELSELGIKRDYSLGYADTPGFKPGVCRPYRAYDLKSDRVLDLEIVPTIVMDSSLKTYLGLSPDESVELVKKLNDEVRKVGGVMVTLFHNSSVSDYGYWKGWKEAYQKIVELCSDR